MGRCRNCRNTEDWKGIDNYYCTHYRTVVDGDDGADCRHFQAKYSGSGGGCVVTTACVEAMGLADDGPELTALRAFRDGYLLRRPEGATDVAEYYRRAPALVAAIDARPDRLSEYVRIHRDMVLPTAALWNARRPKAAWRIYRRRFRALCRRFPEADGASGRLCYNRKE